MYVSFSCHYVDILQLLRNKYGLNVTTSEYPLDAKKFAFYNGATATMVGCAIVIFITPFQAISMVKPALFDFALLLFVGAYFVGMYFVIQVFRRRDVHLTCCRC